MAELQLTDTSSLASRQHQAFYQKLGDSLSEQFARFNRLLATTLWGLRKLKDVMTGLEMVKLQLAVSSVLVSHQQPEIQKSLKSAQFNHGKLSADCLPKLKMTLKGSHSERT